MGILKSGAGTPFFENGLIRKWLQRSVTWICVTPGVTSWLKNLSGFSEMRLRKYILKSNL